MIKIIKTKNLQLVNFDTKYAQDLLELWNDYEVIKYTNMQVLNSVDECKNKIEMFINYTDEQFTNNFIILLDGKAVGIIGAPVINMENKEFGFYYQLSRKYWRNGYISEASSAFMEYLKKSFPKAIINAEVVSLNNPSLSILKKLGFKKISLEKNAFTRNNLKFDLIKLSNNI